MVVLPCAIWESLPYETLFLHILIPLTILGAFANTYLFNPTRDKILCRDFASDERKRLCLIQLWIRTSQDSCGNAGRHPGFRPSLRAPVMDLPAVSFLVAGCKLIVVWISLADYERRGVANNENKLGKLAWLVGALLIAAAYALPALGILLPWQASACALCRRYSGWASVSAKASFFPRIPQHVPAASAAGHEPAGQCHTSHPNPHGEK